LIIITNISGKIMKTFINLSIVLVLLFSFGCSKKEEVKLTAFNAEAFAYDLSDGWELNSTVRVKGLTYKEENKKFLSSMDFTVDLITPKGDTVKSIFKGSDKKENSEKAADLPLEAQVNLDSTYKAGKYKVVFNITDNFGSQKTTAVKEFEISKE
jgi:hypothetical protein